MHNRNYSYERTITGKKLCVLNDNFCETEWQERQVSFEVLPRQLSFVFLASGHHGWDRHPLASWDEQADLPHWATVNEKFKQFGKPKNERVLSILSDQWVTRPVTLAWLPMQSVECCFLFVRQILWNWRIVLLNEPLRPSRRSIPPLHSPAEW